MSRKLSPENDAAVRALRHRLLLTIQFFENTNEFAGAPEWRELVESAAANGRLRDLRLLAREIDAMSIALAPNEREGLEAVLRERLGVDKDAERRELGQQIAKVLQRGKIASEKERRRLEEYVEMLEATGGDPGEIEAVNALLRSG